MRKTIVGFASMLGVAIAMLAVVTVTKAEDVRFMPQTVSVNESKGGVVKVSIHREAGHKQRIRITNKKDGKEVLSLVCDNDKETKSGQFTVDGICDLEIIVDNYDPTGGRWNYDVGKWSRDTLILSSATVNNVDQRSLSMNCEDVYPSPPEDFDDATITMTFEAAK